MTDVHTTVIRSKNMRAIRSKDTKPELLVRKILHAAGLRFRLHRTDLPGKPDIVLPKYRAVIFVHGCFWHRHPGCKFSALPVTRRDFWQKKLDENVTRDANQIIALEAMGWKTFVIWECQVKEADVLDSLAQEIKMRLPRTSESE